MKVSQFLAFLVAAQAISAASIPETSNALHAIKARRNEPSEITNPDFTLERRKGGGGRGGGSSSGGSSSGGGRSSGGSSGGSSGRTSSSSNTGGATRSGSGPARSFGGGKYYAGGASTPYKAGSRTPSKGLLAGALILPATLLLVMPGLWLYNVYPYYYNNPYRFYNRTATNDDNNNNNNDKRGLWTRQTQGRNESLPVMCLCQEYSVCGCEENDNDQSYLNDLVGNGSYAALNKSLITVSTVNGTKTLVLNGTLPNGTTAPGGTDDDSAAVNLRVGKYAGYYVVGVMVLAGVFI
ncbi:conserved glycine-rich [Pyrenophora seminiperda CCB06]|uniref:Conserved glycine-rich n=1 Tax=Pyrenophora seminiperda CCB06 TaxID=1302712 RepID=A0A3M7LYL5_9PLEO|nr:conserved glycine-rich [Pyrenophora seminiperda CCB06]